MRFNVMYKQRIVIDNLPESLAAELAKGMGEGYYIWPK